MTIESRARGESRASLEASSINSGRGAQLRGAMRFALGDQELVILTDELSALGFIDGKIVTQAGDPAVVLRDLIAGSRQGAHPPRAEGAAERTNSRHLGHGLFGARLAYEIRVKAAGSATADFLRPLRATARQASSRTRGAK